MQRLGPRLLLLCLAVGAGLFLSRDTWGRAQRAKAQRDAAYSELRSAEAERRDTAARVARSQNPLGHEEAARERGYRRPAETPVEQGP
jgi:hypothetical protein